VANGARHSLVLCAEGAVAAWGYSESGQIGDGDTTSRYEPVWVDQTGVLAGKSVVAVAAGTAHSLALCDDGTLAAWGNNNYGALGNNSTTRSTVPVRVTATGVLAGKQVVAIAAGDYHNFALCSDGSLAAWGRNTNGQLGNNSTTNSLVPVWVDQTGILGGRTVTAIAAGLSHSLVLCSDGSLVAWGANDKNQLGDNGALQSNVPVLVRQGSLAGRTVVAIAAGGAQNLARCADGGIATWGYNASGQLGNNSKANGRIPGPLASSGVLSGTTIVDVAAGDSHSLAVSADGTVAGWGANSYGQLGTNNTTAGLVPVSTSAGGLTENERVITGWAGEYHSLIQAAVPPPPLVFTREATDVRDHTATLNGSVNANGPDAAVSFEYGLTDSYGARVEAVPGTVAGSTAKPASVSIEGLSPGVIYHYRALAANEFGTTLGEDRTFTTTTFGALSGLTLSDGTLAPEFSESQADYLATVPFAVGEIAVNPVAAHPGASIAVNGMAVNSGTFGVPVRLAVGDNLVNVAVTSADGVNAMIYHIRVWRLPESLEFDSATDAVITADDFSASGITLEFTLNFAPLPGTRLKLLDLTGTRPLRGAFDNLAQGQIVGIDHGDNTYRFVVNYHGGTGNDLELQWLNSRVVAWGANSNGQLGNATNTSSKVPVPVDMSGVLADKAVIDLGVATQTDGFGSRSIALGADGTVAAWGSSNAGALGAGLTTSSRVPIEVDRSGVLSGKSVSAVAAGPNSTYALCSDGTLSAWGSNSSGLLGNDSGNNSSVPVAVSRNGALLGKSVVEVATGVYHVLALCADGTVVSWGGNSQGVLGTGGTMSSRVPLRVQGLPAGKQVVAVAAGSSHSLALCSDGTVFGWGANNQGQLGNNSITPSSIPVAVDTSGILAGRSIVAIAAGSQHSLALCSDGSVVGWGANDGGQLGDNSNTNRSLPVEVVGSGVLAGKTVIRISVIDGTSFALCSDGTLAAWGYSALLGTDSTTSSKVPVAVSTAELHPGEIFMRIAGASRAGHAIGVTALPLQSAASTDATAITSVSATLNGSVNANWNATSVVFEYGLTASYGHTIAATPADLSDGVGAQVSADLGGLTSGVTYHYRVVATSRGGIVRSGDMAFTTVDHAKLASLALNAGTMAPDFRKLTMDYVATVPYDTSGVTLTPVTDHPRATVRVDGVPVASGSASGVIVLPVGETTITTAVTADDGFTTRTYTVTVTRLPRNFTFHSASDVPVSSNGFAAEGYPAILALDYAPVPGTILMVVNNRSLGFIHGRFKNLAQGQRVTLRYGGMSYDFVANYFGGTGNDLVLQWADTIVAAWGSNSYGQLGDGTTTQRLLPTSIDDSGLLSGKTIVAVGGGYLHSLALCSDGTLAAWGYNTHGQLGNNSTAPGSVPVAVDRSGVLAGRTVIAISAGPFHNLALCSDGTVAAWGFNNHGQLGTGDKVTSRVPVKVNRTGALAGRQVVAVAAGAYHSFALCSDGSVAAWGYNDEGELGNGGKSGSLEPVAVDLSGALAGKRIASISAGQYHTLALCTDGTLAAWGYNNRGQLGNDSTVSSKVPVAIGAFGALAGKTVVATDASGAHSLALCSDGTLAAWGWNHRGQLGAAGIAQSTVPVANDATGLAAGSSLSKIAVGSAHSLVLRADGTLAAWGDNAYGQLGNNSLTAGHVPTAVDTSSLVAGSRVMFIASGSAALHNLAVVALPSARQKTLKNRLQTTSAGKSDDEEVFNLIEYAFGLKAGEGATGALPQAQTIGDRFVIRFTQPAGVTGITYGAEWSRTLLPGSWTNVPDSGTGTEHIFSIPAGTPNLFMRLKVTD
jgi:alpha-tubulin suppressor-like RCC1 family protein